MNINDIKQTKFFVSHVWPGMIDVKCSKCGKMIATLQKREIEQVNKNVYFAKKQISCFNCNEVIPEGMLIAENKKYLDNLEINDSVLALLDSANEKAKLYRQKREKEEKEKASLVYNLVGCAGRSLRVYDNKCVFKVDPTIGAMLTNNATDGEKTVYYSDVIGIQFKPCLFSAGYLQLETASSAGNNKSSNFFNENSFTYDLTNKLTNEEMEKVVDYIKERIEVCKEAKNNPIVAAPVAAVSVADEIKKFKELLDMGAITQDEFDAKKKQLLDL